MGLAHTDDCLLPTVKPTSRPPRYFFVNLIIGFVSVIAALVLIELAFRLIPIFYHPVGISPTADRPRRFLTAHGPRLVEVQLAQLPRKSPQEFRIIAIGDSFTYGQGIQLDDTYSKRLERILNFDTDGRIKASVFNAGVEGYSAAQELELLKKVLSLAKPDLVIWQITLNDPEIEPFRVSHKYLDEHGRPKVTAPVFQYWKSLGFVVERILNSITHKQYINYYFDLFNKPETWGRFSESVSSAKELALSAHVPFFVAVFPLFNHSLGDDYPFTQLHQKVDGLLNSLGVPYIDLLKVFSPMNHDRLTIEPGQDSHPNEIAHRVAAERIFFELREKRLVPGEFWGKRFLDRR